jgi:hypothetical protein
MAADRGAFVDQSQSFNVHMTNVNYGKLTSSKWYDGLLSRSFVLLFCVAP